MPGELVKIVIYAVYTGQYVKEETLTIGPNGKVARATRLITERASRRIGLKAFDIALARPRKVSPGIQM